MTPGKLDDPAYEMMRGHKREVRLLCESVGKPAGSLALVMEEHPTPYGIGYLMLRFRNDPRIYAVITSDAEPIN